MRRIEDGVRLLRGTFIKCKHGQKFVGEERRRDTCRNELTFERICCYIGAKHESSVTTRAALQGTIVSSLISISCFMHWIALLLCASLQPNQQQHHMLDWHAILEKEFPLFPLAAQPLHRRRFIPRFVSEPQYMLSCCLFLLGRRMKLDEGIGNSVQLQA